jgi:hypothetical protein
VLLPMAALAILASRLQPDERGRRGWLRAIRHWRTLLIATAAFIILVALPWRAAFWQTQGLPQTWIEPAVAGIRLAVIAALIAIGFAIIVVTTARQTVQSPNHVKT